MCSAQRFDDEQHPANNMSSSADIFYMSLIGNNHVMLAFDDIGP